MPGPLGARRSQGRVSKPGDGAEKKHDQCSNRTTIAGVPERERERSQGGDGDEKVVRWSQRTEALAPAVNWQKPVGFGSQSRCIS